MGDIQDMHQENGGMPTIQDAKNRRDEALQHWRHELRLLEGLRARSAKWDKQRNAVERARSNYDEAVAEYLDMLTGGSGVRKQGAA